MSCQEKADGPAPWRRDVDGVLRHPDGSPDIAAYGKIAHRERDAAILSAVQDAARTMHAMSSAIWRVLGRSDRIRSNAPLRG